MTEDSSSVPSRAGAPPEMPAPSPAILLISLGRHARESVESRLRAVGLAYHHLSALGHLKTQPGLSYSELARRARVTVQSMQTTVAHLEQLGLVDRGERTRRGRRADLQVTRGGLTLLAAGEAAIRAVDAELVAEFDVTERQSVEAALLRMFLRAAAQSPPQAPANDSLPSPVVSDSGTDG